MGFKHYLGATVFIAILLWGPIDKNIPYWFLIRCISLFFIPLIIITIVERIKLKAKTEVILIKALSSIITCVLVANAYLAGIKKYHYENDEYIITRDGREYVGDFIKVPGPDYFQVVLLLFLALLVFILGVAKQKESKRS
jgi:hypothetical protein